MLNDFRCPSSLHSVHGYFLNGHDGVSKLVKISFNSYFNQLPENKFGVFDIKTPEVLNDNTHIPHVRLGKDGEGILVLDFADGPKLKLRNPVPFMNIMRKWNKMCVSFDFEKNEAQAAINGRPTDLIRNPETAPNMKGTFDAKLIKNASPGTSLLLTIGRYVFDNK